MKREFSPILLGEVISIKNESDRWRMLLQLAICARVNAFITSSPLVVQAVYLSGTYRAERYLAYADKVGRMSDKLDIADSRQGGSSSDKVPSVYITRDIFDVATRDGAVKFLRSMYNFQSVVLDADGSWDSEKGELWASLEASLQRFPGLTSQSQDSEPKTPKSQAPQGGRSASLPSISEHAHTLAQRGFAIRTLSTMVCVFRRHICGVLIFGPFLAPTHRVCRHSPRRGGGIETHHAGE